MSHHRSRGQSPPKYYGDEPRGTTGAVYVTSFDTGSRGGSQQPRASVSTVSSGGRSSVAYKAQPTHKSTMSDGTTKTRYTVQTLDDARQNSDARRLSAISTTPNSISGRDSGLASPRQTNSAVLRDDASRFLLPVPSHGHHPGYHQRNNSTSMADTGSREVARERREKTYHPRPPYVERVHPESRPPARAPDDEGWSYTGPREQFDRDYPQRPPAPRENVSRRERPFRDYEIDRPAAPREHMPTPAVNRHLHKDDPARYDTRSGFDSDPDRRVEAPKRRSSTRQPVVHQQPARDDGYSSARDDYERRRPTKQKEQVYDDDEPRPRERQRDVPREVERERPRERKYHKDQDRDRPREYDREYDKDYNRDYDREYDREYDRNYDKDYDRDDRSRENRRKPRSRDSSPERSGLKGLAKGAIGGLAAAGVVKGLSRDHKEKDVEPNDDEDQREKRHKRHRRRSRQEDQYEDSERNDDRRSKDDRARSRRHDSPDSDHAGEDPPKKAHTHRRHRDDEDQANEKPLLPEEDSDRNSPKSRPRDQEESFSDNERSSRALVPIRRRDQDFESLESRTISPGENEDDRPRRVQLVEPVKEKEDIRPRGILKPARQVPFPEDPNPIREGVAPLKDATKDGIPPNARWTKINRLLVNPEALEKAHERFEERDEYVIVLRVLTREEIKKLADKTKEIRDAREAERPQERDDRRYHQTGNKNDGAGSDGEIDYDDDRNAGQRAPLAIEQGPSAPPADLRGQTYSMPVRGVPSGPPIPDTNVDANYSQNV